jgi:hypothetical protein
MVKLNIFEVTIKTLKFFGLWIPKNSTRKELLVGFFIQFILVNSTLMLQFLYLIEGHSLLEFTTCLSIFSSTIAFTVKLINLQWNSTKIFNLMELIQDEMKNYVIGADHDREYKKIANIFMQFFSKKTEISVGKIFQVNLSTFMGVCNSAYSMYAVFKKINNR